MKESGYNLVVLPSVGKGATDIGLKYVNNDVCYPSILVTGKGAIKALRKAYSNSNIVAIDYDPGASEVNQLNRIKLMLSTAFKNLKEEKNN